MSELSLAKAEHRRAMYWRQSALRMVSSLERQLAAARLKGDVDALQLAQQVAEAERAARLAAVDLASARRILDRTTGSRR
jgi:hypothetical protein